MQQQDEYIPDSSDSINWWSWRPGIRPRNALALGGLLTLLAVLLASIGLITLVLGLMDNSSAPLQLPGIVSRHTIGSIDGFPRLDIHLHTAGFPVLISPVVSQPAYRAIQDGDQVLVDYSPHLHFLYALEHAGVLYALPGSSITGYLLSSIALLLLGLLLFPYPALLTLWSIRDIQAARHGKVGHCTLEATIIGKRAAVRNPAQKRSNRPGLTPQLSRAWYGVALEPLDPHSSLPIMTFSISRDTYNSLREGTPVHITYSPHLHYVYTLKSLL